MIKRLVALLLVFVMVIAPVAPVMASVSESARPTFDFRFDLVYENAYAQLLVDRRNNTIRVVNKATGQYFNTLAMEAQQGNPIIQNRQRSDFELDIVRDVVTGRTANMDSFSESVERRQIEYTYIEGGIRTYFTLGDPDAITITMFPRYISPERLEYLVIQHLDDMTFEFLRDHYTLIDGRWIRRHLTYDPHTGEATRIGLPVLRRLNAIFYHYGEYTIEELDYDNAYWEYAPFEPPLLVSLAVEYTLDGPDLIVTVPREHMHFDEVQPFRSITLHPYLVSGSIHDDGFLFIPDGSGGIIRFNNGMTMEEVNIPVFGRDLLMESWNFHEFFEQATLPIFGMVRNDMGILAIIEEGAPVATIHANVSGRLDEYNRVFASFDLSFFEGLLLRGTGIGATAVQHMDVYDLDIRMRYVMLTGDDASYVGMARAYRNYLQERDLLRSNPIPEDAPFFVNIYASAPRQRMRFGIPVTHHFPMTSTQQAQDILESLTQQDVRNIHAQYSHWANDGMLSSSFYRLRPLRTIGGSQGMRELEEFSTSIGANLFPALQASTLTTPPPRRLGRINFTMAARNIGNAPQWWSWRAMFDRSFAGGALLLSPAYWLRYANRLVSNFLNLGLRNISITDMGSLLFGNYGRRVQEITRLDAVDYANEALAAFAQDTGLMLTNPNVYGFAHASVITDLPFRPGGRRIVDYNIPFVQMVLENNIPFSMPAYNLDPMSWRGFTEYMLRAVESRSSMQLLLTYANEEEFLPTFQQFWVLNALPFMTQYSRWEDRIGYYYAQYNAFFQAVRGAYTIGHEVLNNGDHVIVSYDNGVRVYINYSEENPWTINDRVIAPLSFEVIR